MKRISELQKLIISLLRESGEQQLSISQLAQQLGVSKMDAYNYVRIMKEKGLIERMTVASDNSRERVVIKLKEDFMNNTITVPTDFTLQGHELKAGAKIEIIKSSEQTFEQIGKRVYRLKKDYNNGDLQLKAGQIIRIIGAVDAG